MPPKAKFTREEIIEMAVEMTRKNGIDSVTARELGTALGSSARPIFTVFSSMEQVRAEVVNYAKREYRRYIKEGLKEELAFKGVGMAYIKFSIKESQFFHLLFMSRREGEENLRETLSHIDENYEEILKSVQEPYGLSTADAEKLYQHLWVYTHGIATMCATGVCNFSGEQISLMITEIFKSLLGAMKRGEV